jgi:hypothetical protein
MIARSLALLLLVGGDLFGCPKVPVYWPLIYLLLFLFLFLSRYRGYHTLSFLILIACVILHIDCILMIF